MLLEISRQARRELRTLVLEVPRLRAAELDLGEPLDHVEQRGLGLAHLDVMIVVAQQHLVGVDDTWLRKQHLRSSELRARRISRQLGSNERRHHQPETRVLRRNEVLAVLALEQVEPGIFDAYEPTVRRDEHHAKHEHRHERPEEETDLSRCHVGSQK